MAYQDALFQLGMDLTRSSTAQKEDHGETARVAHNVEPVSGRHESRDNYFIERDGVRFAGNHLIIDLSGACKLDDLKHIELTLKRCVEVAGATVQHVHLHRGAPNSGVTGVAVLSGGHLSIHTWPEAGYAALDVFMRGDAKPSACVGVLQDAFMATKVVVKASPRGEDLEADHMAPVIAARAKDARTTRQRTRVRKAA